MIIKTIRSIVKFFSKDDLLNCKNCGGELQYDNDSGSPVESTCSNCGHVRLNYEHYT